MGRTIQQAVTRAILSDLRVTTSDVSERDGFIEIEVVADYYNNDDRTTKFQYCTAADTFPTSREAHFAAVIAFCEEHYRGSGNTQWYAFPTGGGYVFLSD